MASKPVVMWCPIEPYTRRGRRGETIHVHCAARTRRDAKRLFMQPWLDACAGMSEKEILGAVRFARVTVSEEQASLTACDRATGALRDCEGSK